MPDIRGALGCALCTAGAKSVCQAVVGPLRARAATCHAMLGFTNFARMWMEEQATAVVKPGEALDDHPVSTVEP